jgi:hypothetical protein
MRKKENRGSLMKLLLLSGLLYLTGVSVVLYLKPEVMFTTEGEWKEFGLGRNPAQYTWLPFWLFTILWAILSYLIVLTLVGSPLPSPSLPSSTASLFSEGEVPVSSEELEPENISTKSLASSIKKRPANAGELKKGYYILDVMESSRKGIPKYIYLGPEAPQMVFRGADGTEAQ